MGQITGRPKKAIVQEKLIKFLVTKSQHAIIRHKAVMAQVTLSDYMRQVALEGQVVRRWTQPEMNLYRKLVAASNQIDRLVKEAGTEELKEMLGLLERYQDKLDRIINTASHVK